MICQHVPPTINALSGSTITPEAAFCRWLDSKRHENTCRLADASVSFLLTPRGLEPLPTLRMHSKPLIVVVDDEPVVAVTLSEILRRRDFEAFWFTDPLAALHFLRRNVVDLLLSDISMPALDGICLAVEVKKSQPDCRIILLSALSQEAMVADRLSSLNLDVTLKAKPFAVDGLISSIRDLLTACRPIQPTCSSEEIAQNG